MELHLILILLPVLIKASTIRPEQSDQGYYDERLNVINLRSQSPGSPLCATILTTSYCLLELPDNGQHVDISEANFIFASAKIEPSCSMTIQDCAGSTWTTSTTLPSFVCSRTTSVCCECGGCDRLSFPLYENSCAILFEHIDCSLCSGFRLEVGDGDQVPFLNDYASEKISSVYVVPGCELVIYKEKDFLGDASLAEGAFNLPFEWNDSISSFQCFCDMNGATSPEMNSTSTEGSSEIPASSTEQDGVTTTESPTTEMPTTRKEETTTLPTTTAIPTNPPTTTAQPDPTTLPNDPITTTQTSVTRTTTDDQPIY